MNKLSVTQRANILSLLCEGIGINAVCRVSSVSKNTVLKLLKDAGTVSATYHDETVRKVKASRIQCDEIWSFVYAKQKNLDTAKGASQGAGDAWTWSALDADNKLIVSYMVGGRDSGYALEFMDDIRSRLANRVQLITDGHKAYLEAVEDAFGADVDYAQLIKLFGKAPEEWAGRYSPANCIGARKEAIEGNPDPKHVSTSHVARYNLTMKMCMRRFTHLTNAFSKKLENHIHMLSLYFVFYNFCKVHKSIRVTPAMEAGLSDTVQDMEWIVGLIDKAAPAPAKRGPYKKRISN